MAGFYLDFSPETVLTSISANQCKRLCPRLSQAKPKLVSHYLMSSESITSIYLATNVLCVYQ